MNFRRVICFYFYPILDMLLNASILRSLVPLSLTCFGIILWAAPTYAQKSQKYYESTEEYRKAIDLFEKEKFGAAQAAFDEIILNTDNAQGEIVANATYYRGVCGLKLFNTNAENLLIEFITDFPESPKVNRAYFDLGLYQYRKRDFDRAASWFEQVNIYNLDNLELAEYYFKLGYAYFREEENEKALQSLYEIKDAETKYSVVAKYYYAHLSYTAGNLEAAMKYFREIEDNPTFSSVIPYYISQILFAQKKYSEVVSYAASIIDSGGSQRSDEIAKLIGESYFRMGEFEKALPYLEQYVKNSNDATLEDRYQIAQVYAKLGQFEPAVNWYQEALSEDDSLNQIVQYNMGEAFIKLNKRILARNAMREASKIGDDRDIHQNALYAYAKLSYELSSYPYNDAIRAFEEFLNTYPDSPKLDEANEYLVGVYFSTRNYEEARKSLDRIEHRGLKLNLAYQRILYYLGVEKMNMGKYEEAIGYFDLAVTNDYERSVKIDALFWKSECWFRLLHYDRSIDDYNKFLFEAGAVSSAYYTLAQYNLGYAYYRKRDYEKALFRFRQYVNNPKVQDPKLKNDAYLRIADAYFVNRDYKNAIEYYDKAAEMAVFDTDYALFQSALAEGVLSNYDAKILKLEKLVAGFDQSLYIDDALYEMGNQQFIKGKTDVALESFNKLITGFPESPYQSKAILKSGLVHFNLKNDQMALDRFKQVVTNFPNTSESQEALDKIKQIYIDKGDLTGFEEFISGFDISKISVSSLDSASYEIAENAYLKNNCDDAVKNLTQYIMKFPGGAFLINAHYYRGECELRSNFKEEALRDFEYVIDQPKNIFTEKSLLHAAGLARTLDYREKAIKYYTALEQKADLASNLDQAQYWLMKLYFKQEELKKAVQYAEKVLAKENLSPDIRNEIYLARGKAYLTSDKFNKAFEDFSKLLSSNDEKAAEGKYGLAYIEYMRGNLDNSEQYINTLLEQIPSYDYWIAKAFILWSDIYLAREDIYQAKVSLQTVIENYEKNDLKQVATEKLNAIKKREELEKKKAKEEEEEQMEIRFTGEEDYDYLFEEEQLEEERKAPEPKPGKSESPEMEMKSGDGKMENDKEDTVEDELIEDQKTGEEE